MASVRKREWSHNGAKKVAWVVDYSDQNGKRRLKTFDKKKDADAFKQKVERELHGGVHTADRETATVERVASEYLEHCVSRNKSGTMGKSHLRSLQLMVRRSIVPFFGARKLANITIDDMAKFVAFMRDEQGLSGSTIANRRATMGRIEAFGRRRGYTRRHIVAEATKDLPVPFGPPIRVPTQEEAQSILRAIEVRERKYRNRQHDLVRCIVSIAMFCGLRIGEIIGLSRGSVDLDRRFIHVRQAISRYDGLKKPKTRAGIRTVPIPEHIAIMIEQWIEAHYLKNEGEFVFTTENGKSLGQSNWNRSWKQVLIKAKLYVDGGDNMHFHALRHFAGSWWLENGLPVPLVSEMLGHSSPEITLRVYSHALRSDEGKQDAMDRIAATLMARPSQQRAIPDATRMQHGSVSA